MEQVEGEVGEVNLCAFLKCGLQVREAGGAFLIEHHCFAVEDCALARELLGRAREVGHAMCPVEAFAGQKSDRFLREPLPGRIWI